MAGLILASGRLGADPAHLGLLLAHRRRLLRGHGHRSSPPTAWWPAPSPTLPLLGLLPTAPLSTVGLWLPLVVTAGAMVAAWRRRAVLNSLRVRYAVSAAGLAALLVAGGVGLLCVAASRLPWDQAG